MGCMSITRSVCSILMLTEQSDEFSISEMDHSFGQQLQNTTESHRTAPLHSHRNLLHQRVSILFTTAQFIKFVILNAITIR